MAYPLYDRSGVDDDVAPILTVTLPRNDPEPAAADAASAAPVLPNLLPLRRRAILILALLAAVNVLLLGTLGIVGPSLGLPRPLVLASLAAGGIVALLLWPPCAWRMLRCPSEVANPSVLILMAPVARRGQKTMPLPLRSATDGRPWLVRKRTAAVS